MPSRPQSIQADRHNRGHRTGVLFAVTNTFPTGQTLHIDGGEPLT